MLSRKIITYPPLTSHHHQIEKILLYLPKLSYNNEAIKDNMVRETTSPIDAANGVAILSGFQLNLWDINITATRTKSEMNGRLSEINDFPVSILHYENCKPDFQNLIYL